MEYILFGSKVSGIPETFNIMLASEYSAVPFVFDAEIGDYLYKFTEPKITGIAVIAQNIPAEVSIRVVCDYDEEYPDKRAYPMLMFSGKLTAERVSVRPKQIMMVWRLLHFTGARREL